jgi:DNA-directed RNA polymerase specialized sigma24 family protein
MKKNAIKFQKVSEEKKVKNRSKAYQATFCEMPIDPHIISDFAERQPLYQQEQNREQLESLKDELYREVREIMETALPEKKKAILLLKAEGLTQREIAVKLKIRPYLVFAHLFKGSKAIMTIMKEETEKSEKCQAILRQIQSLGD